MATRRSASSPPSDRHRHPIANHQPTAHFDLGSVTGDKPRLEPPREQRRENVRFKHGEVVAEADPLPAAEQEVGEGMAFFFALGQKAKRSGSLENLRQVTLSAPLV